MRRNFFTQILRFFCCSLLVLATFIPQDSHAIFQGVRSSHFSDATGKCDVGSLSFNPVVANDDLEWELSNSTCVAYIASVGTVLVATDTALKFLCVTPNPALMATNVGENAADLAPPPPLPFPNPGIVIRMIRKTSQCIARNAEAALTTAAVATNCPAFPPLCFSSIMLQSVAVPTAIKCCAGVAAYYAELAAAIGALAVIYDLARITFEDAAVCGYQWQKWYTSSDLDKGKEPIIKKGKGNYRICVEQLFTGVPDSSCAAYGITLGNSSQTIGNKFFREYVYGGMEFEDNGEGACKNPSTWDKAKRLKLLGYSDENQRYYMTGPGAPSAFACHRFVTAPNPAVPNDSSETKVAFDCCKRRSQNAICIYNRTGFGKERTVYEHKFCEVGSRCTVKTISFEAYESKKQPSYICAKTYSVCPFNHPLAGGTEEKAMKENDNSMVANYCQFMNHCSKIPIQPYVRSSNLEGGFISSACRDMKGDSQNVYGYSSQLLSVVNTRGFSAPLVQCFKETMENIFLNKAGETKCKNPDEDAVSDVCASGYIYRKGGDLPTPSFFIRVQNSLQTSIKVVLTLSVAFFGIMTLFGATGGSGIEKKRLYPYIIKIGLVMYFAVGDGWQYGFMKGVVGTSSFLAEVVFKNDESGPDNKLDGCQFPRFNYMDPDDATKYSDATRQYPSGKEYLRVWDTLDCKIGRALGFGPEVSVPNLVMMIIGGFFTGGAGVVFFLGAFTFAFFLLSITIRAIHIFLLSITSIILLMYVSPIVITAGMFEKSKEIFTKWRGQLIGFVLQPMILFCYLGVVITIFDKVVIGDVTFSGASANDPHGRISPKTINCTGEAANTSIYCIFRIADIKTFNGFEALGIGIPMITSMNSEKVNTIIKASMLMFILMKLMDQISDFASKLVGGAALKSDWGSMSKMMSKSYGTLRGIQTRGMAVAKKHGGAAIRSGIQGAANIGHMAMSRGKGVEKDDGGKPAGDHASGSGAARTSVGDHAGSTTGSTASAKPADRAGSSSGSGDKSGKT